MLRKWVTCEQCRTYTEPEQFQASGEETEKMREVYVSSS